MTKWKLIALCLLSTPSFAYVNLGGAWFGNGGDKIAMENKWPLGNCSTCAITANWDGTTAKLYGVKDEVVGGMLWLQGGNSANATSVTVQMSPLVNGSSVISSTAVLCANVTNYLTRDFEIFVSTYIRIKGMTKTSWETTSSPLEPLDVPYRFRNTLTVSSGHGSETAPNLWITRPDHDKLYPDALIPHECKSSFTVYQSSSFGVWFDIYLSTSLTAGVHTGTITVKEGVTVSTTIPISVTVYNATMPRQPSLKYIGFLDEDAVNFRINNKAHDGSVCTSANCLATDRAFFNAIHRHRMISIGDYRSTDLTYAPTQRYVDQLNGNSFTQTYGYRGPGASTGVPVYSIGTYGHWRDFQSYVTTVSSSFCTVISSWGAWFDANSPTTRPFIYLEDEPTNLTQVNRWSHWMSTMTACKTSTTTIHSMTTVKWPLLVTGAPYIDTPMTTLWFGPGPSGYTKTHWEQAAARYVTQGSTQGWGYNGHPPGSGTCYAIEDDGISCWMTSVGAYKKGLNGWYQWAFANWYALGQALPTENPLWEGTSEDPAKTFGYLFNYTSFTVSGMSTTPTCDYANGGSTYQRIYTSLLTGSAPNIGGQTVMGVYGAGTGSPSVGGGTLTKIANTCGGDPTCFSCTGDATISFSSWTRTYVHPMIGHSGSDHANGDGVLMYPGNDVTYPQASQGFKGPINSMRMKYIRYGQNFVDYLTLANAINPTATDAILDTLVSDDDVLWEKECFNPSDCSYIYGGRTWNNSPKDWEQARRDLAAIFEGVAPPEPAYHEFTFEGKGRIRFQGNVKFQ